MSISIDTTVDYAPSMSPYERQVWNKLNEHWQRRNNRRGLANWAGKALVRTGDATGKAVNKVAGVVPEGVKQPLRRAGDAVAGAAVRPVLEGVVALLDPVNDWALELNDPKGRREACREARTRAQDFRGTAPAGP